MTRAGDIDWIAADLSGPVLRAWAMRNDRPATMREGDAAAGFAALVGAWTDAEVPVTLCGLAEVPARDVPCAPLSAPLAAEAGGMPVRAVPGLRQTTPPDAMHGDETAIAGMLDADPAFDGVACVLGAQSRWVRISAGEVVGFRSFLTRELYDLLVSHSVLRHSTAGEGWSAAAFEETVARTFEQPAGLAAGLFGIRAESLLMGLEPGPARARLAGALIGAELAAARPYWREQDVVVIGDGERAAQYARALELAGATPATFPAHEATLAGLVAAHRRTESRT